MSATAGLPEVRRVDRIKIEEYLLHPVNGRGKAAFFQAFGFTALRWHELRDALLDQAQSGVLLDTARSSYGTRYVVCGSLRTPDGRDPPPVVCTVWQADNGLDGVRLITAYPA
jgi:hypothetical protein